MVGVVKDIINLDQMVLVEVVVVVHLVLVVGVDLAEVALNLAKLEALVVTGETLVVVLTTVEVEVMLEEQLLGLIIV
jgi:hypothetical protein